MKSSLSKKTKNKKDSAYVKHKGVLFERMSENSVELAIDLKEDVYNNLTNLVTSGKFVSIGDAIRYILRRELEELDLQGK